LNYGLFLNAIFNFSIIAVSVFFLVRQVNRVHRMQQQAVELKECPFCFSAVRAKAVRCPMCTSHLDMAKASPAGG
jgi:large conductance mechanosensitive channel